MGAVSRFAAHPPSSPGAYQNFLKALPPDTAARFTQVVPPEEYDPAKSPGVLRQAALTPEQQTQALKPPAEKDNVDTWIATVNDPNASPQDKAQAQANLKLSTQYHKDQRVTVQIPAGPGGKPSMTAQAIAAGKMNPLTARAMLRRDPALMNQVLAADPNFDEADLENRYNTLKEFTNTSNTKAGGQLLALNTLVHHADLYRQVAESLNNGDFRPGNAAYNAVANLFGSAPPTQANLVAQFLAGETGKVATGGVPGEQEVKRVLDKLGSDAGPDQIKGASDALLEIAAGRMIPLKERRDQAKLQNQVQILGPDATAILQRRGYDPNTLKPVVRGAGGSSGGTTTIKIGNKLYQYKGSGSKKDLNNWAPLP